MHLRTTGMRTSLEALFRVLLAQRVTATQKISVRKHGDWKTGDCVVLEKAAFFRTRLCLCLLFTPFPKHIVVAKQLMCDQ